MEGREMGGKTHLLSNNPAKLLIAMAQRIDSNTRRKVQVLAVLQIPEVRALALDEDRRRARVGRHHVRDMLADHLAAGRVLGRVGVGELSGGIGAAGNGNGAGTEAGNGRVDGGDPAEGGAEGHGDGMDDGRTGRRDSTGPDGMEGPKGDVKREEAEPAGCEGKGSRYRKD